ncbi:glycoside hydrolase family 75 protein [Plenodomus tracheiphilus IPT5]|uniref:Endo-chitosanase n=1 Tax=Plenodomus tracheiphilus IPT5 TaxID=1408161 RepID=A0A6A7AT76_9PLEO|nr:glycoside hydrolase family 75 protein [Plenodomus tracheiphilus IPT5]
MHYSLSIAISTVILALTHGAASREVPENVRSFYNRIVADGSCPNPLQGGFHSAQNDSNDFGYCHDEKTGVIYLQGQNGQLVNMDIDCDGTQGGAGEDGRCGDSNDTQSQTSFKDTVAGYGAGVEDLNAKVHSYVVFGNDGTSPSFNPQEYGIEPLSLMAVVCGEKLVYGVWGDANGNDGQPLVGEASISLATACYGKENINGNAGHDENDVLYIAFPGGKAVPGAQGANWNPQSFEEFESSIETLGDELVATL